MRLRRSQIERIYADMIRANPQNPRNPRSKLSQYRIQDRLKDRSAIAVAE